MDRHQILRLALLIIVMLLIVWVGYHYRDEVDLVKMQQLIESYGIWAPVVFILIYIAATVLFLPGAAMTILGGLIFGAAKGTFYNLFAATVGSTLAFLIARYIASDWVTKRTGGRLKQLIEGVEQEGWRFVAVMRLIPIVPFNLLNYALGLTRIDVWHFIIASAVFMLPGAFAYTYVGSLGHTAIQGEARDVAVKALFALGLLVIVGLIPWMVKRYRGVNQESGKE